jgi:hypothetical protein
MQWHKDSLKKYAVAFGDRWQAGPHRFLCGDLETNELVEWLDGPVDFVYTDPPWGQSYASMFSKQAGLSKPPSFGRLLYNLAKFSSLFVKHDVFVVMGLSATEQVARKMRQFDILEVARYPKTYQASNKQLPCVLWHGLKAGHSSLFSFRTTPAGTHAGETLEVVLVSAVRPGRMLEPCAGVGYFVGQAIAAGHEVRAMEYNPRRLAECLARVASLGRLPKREVTAAHSK